MYLPTFEHPRPSFPASPSPAPVPRFPLPRCARGRNAAGRHRRCAGARAAQLSQEAHHTGLLAAARPAAAGTAAGGKMPGCTRCASTRRRPPAQWGPAQEKVRNALTWPTTSPANDAHTSSTAASVAATCSSRRRASRTSGRSSSRARATHAAQRLSCVPLLGLRPPPDTLCSRMATAYLWFTAPAHLRQTALSRCRSRFRKFRLDSASLPQQTHHIAFRSRTRPQ